MTFRWSASSADELIADVDAEHTASIPDTGALRSDLVAVMKALRDKSTMPYVEMMNELVAAARRDEVLAQLEVLRRAVRRRALSRSVDTELVHDVAEALILRQLQTRLPFDDAFIARVVDRVIIPLLTPKRRQK